MSLVLGDCLIELKKISEKTIDMIYLDPPFYTQKDQKLTNREGQEFSFTDKWNTRTEYLDFMKIRLIEMKRILKDTGNIFLHCDKSASHYLRVILDEVFGYDNFRSEIIWSYRRWSNSKRGLLDGHQTIFYYSKSKDYKFNIEYTDYSPTTNIDQILQERVRDNNGKSIYKRDSDGNIVNAQPKKGVPLSDVWEIPFLNPKANERVGYPTQKPINLLEKIISISTDEEDLVLDPFCGSGTTLVAAKLLGRQYIGIDSNPDAIKLSRERLANPFKTDSNLLIKGKGAYENKSELEKKTLESLNCDIVQRNKGLDGIFRRKINEHGIGIKFQRENEKLQDSIKYLYKAMEKKGFKISFLVKTKNDKNNHKISIPDGIIIIDNYKIKIEEILDNIEKSNN